MATAGAGIPDPDALDDAELPRVGDVIALPKGTRRLSGGLAERMEGRPGDGERRIVRIRECRAERNGIAYKNIQC